MFIWDSFENHCDVLLRKFSKRQEETNIDHSKKIYENAYCQTNKTTVTTQ